MPKIELIFPLPFHRLSVSFHDISGKNLMFLAGKDKVFNKEEITPILIIF